MAAILHQQSDPPPGTEDEFYCNEQHSMAQLVGPVVLEDRGLDAIEGACTNSIITSEFPLLDVVTPASSSFKKTADNDVMERQAGVAITKAK